MLIPDTMQAHVETHFQFPNLFFSKFVIQIFAQDLKEYTFLYTIMKD